MKDCDKSKVGYKYRSLYTQNFKFQRHEKKKTMRFVKIQLLNILRPNHQNYHSTVSRGNLINLKKLNYELQINNEFKRISSINKYKQRKTVLLALRT
jgi:hypothetical protein